MIASRPSYFATQINRLSWKNRQIEVFLRIHNYRYPAGELKPISNSQVTDNKKCQTK